MRIGALAIATDTPVSTIRYYEQIGLLQSAARQSGNQRVYDETDVHRLNFVRRIREFGFPLDKARLMLGLLDNPQGACAKTREIAFGHLAEIRARMTELAQLERTLASLVGGCDQALATGRTNSCALLDELASEVPGSAG